MFKGISLAASLLLVASVLMTSCSTSPKAPESGSAPTDPFLWLEDLHAPKALDWVKDHNDVSSKLLTEHPLYPKIFEDIKAVELAQDRIPEPSQQGGWVYNFWRDAIHVKGLWRRVTKAEYAKASPAWETVLDLDQLAQQEKENWVWGGSNCLPPAYQKCLLSFSRGGKDAMVVREFDTQSKSFVEGGFSLPEAKSMTSWLDADTIWVSTDFGAGSMSTSGYPLVAKRWKRGTSLSEAVTVHEGKPTDLWAGAYTVQALGEKPVHIFYRAPSFFESENLIYTDDGKKHLVPFPMDACFEGIFKGQVLARLRTNWAGPREPFPAGALVSIALADIVRDAPTLTIQTVYYPKERATLSGVIRSSDALYLEGLDNVVGRILKVERIGNQWRVQTLAMPPAGALSVKSSDPFSPDVFISYESFLVPPTVYSYAGKSTPKPVKSLPARFDASRFEVEQHESVSKDGTRIPYFLIHKKGMQLNRNQPTLLYGYGGFEHSMTPFYSGRLGKAWLERGGVYALGNIRGGGEFGPKWHEAALRKNRQVAFDDFISVAADLFRLHITHPSRLALKGGSNGGLLVGAMLAQRPDLFKAAVVAFPVLDMLRYNKLPTGAGSSWVGEYGDPDDAEMGQVLAKYSPYANIKKGITYPRAFFESSIFDDRVSPAHARKMVAKLEAFGHPALYFEELTGGHATANDLEQAVREYAREYTYLWNELGTE